MKRYINIISVFALLAVFVSCDYLDRDSGDNITVDEMFSRIETAEGYINNAYIFLPDYMCDTEDYAGRYNIGCCTDEMGFQQQTNYGVQSPFGINFGSWSSTSMPLQKSWAEYYQCIRRCNMLIANYDKIPEEITPSGINRKERLLGEAYGLRGYFYFLLFRMWGGVPLFENVIDPGDEKQTKGIKRADAETTVKFIVSDLEKAAKLLPVTQDDANFGRFTALVAKVAISQAKMFWASPLWNPDNEIARWTDAAAACREALNMAKENGYTLTPSYDGLFTNIIASEYIFVKNSILSECFWWDYYHYPTGFGGAYNVEGPLQEMIDAFEMDATGELPVLGYNTDCTQIVNPLASDYDEEHPWSGRDPRFYYCIMCHNDKLQDKYIDTSEGSTARFGSQNRTFYYVKKYTDVNHDITKPYSDMAFTYRRFAIMRTTELYLNLAECANEAEGVTKEVKDCLNEIRSRAGCSTSVPDGLSKEQMRDRIRRERRVEMCFEGQRFFDVRRWDISRIVDDGISHRVEVKVLRDENGDKILDDEGRTFITEIQYPEYMRRTFKANLFPIPQSEIDKNNDIEQNPEWISSPKQDS